MYVYWLLILPPVIFAFFEIGGSGSKFKTSRWSLTWTCIFFYMVLFLWLRDGIGPDWMPYESKVDDLRSTHITDVDFKSDPGFVILNWFGANIFGGIYFVNFIGALIFTYGLEKFCLTQTRPWLSLVIAIPYLVIVVAVGYTRQGIAIGFAFLAIISLIDKRFIKFCVFILFATIFHKSAAIIVVLALFCDAKKNWIKFISIPLLLAALMSYFIIDSLVEVDRIYISNENFSSKGAFIRILLCAIPSIVLIFFSRYIKFKDVGERKFWITVAYISIAALFFEIISSKYINLSTLLDRLALYLIPIQMVVLSRVPDTFSRKSSLRTFSVLSVILYCISIQFVWLNYADNATAWIPYKSIL